MSRSNKTQFALLGILTLGPMSGYDIKKMFDGSLRHFWTESYGQIYPILRRLVAQGWATQKDDNPPGRPARKVYAVTAKGRQALRTWLEEAVEPPSYRLELLLKLFFGTEMPPATSRRHLLQFRQWLTLTLEEYRTIETQLKQAHGDSAGLPYWLITLDFGISYVKATLGWCDRTLRRVKG